MQSGIHMKMNILTTDSIMDNSNQLLLNNVNSSNLSIYDNISLYTDYVMQDTVAQTDYDYYSIPDRADRMLAKPATIMALILGFLALIANAISLIVVTRVLKKARRQAAHFGFIISLTSSDMLFSFSLMLFIINKMVNPIYFPQYGTEKQRLNSRCIFIFLKALNTTALNAELLSLMGMAIDHYLAITRPLHYSLLLNKKSYVFIIIIFWTLAILCGFSDFLYVIHDAADWKKYKHKFNLCEFIYFSTYQEEYATFAIAGLCLICMVVSYSRMYMVIKNHHCVSRVSQGVNRSRKALATTLLLLGTFMICWLPMCLFQVAMIIQVQVNPDAVYKLVAILLKFDQHLYNLLLLNALIDPIIYAVRTHELRLGYIKLMREVFGCKKAYGSFERSTLSKKDSTTSSEAGNKKVPVYRLSFTSYTEVPSRSRSTKSQTKSFSAELSPIGESTRQPQDRDPTLGTCVDKDKYEQIISQNE